MHVVRLIIVSGAVLASIGCRQAVQLPPFIIGTWAEETRQSSLFKEEVFDSIPHGASRWWLRLEQNAGSAVAYVALTSAATPAPDEWSPPLRIRKLDERLWEFTEGDRDVNFTITSDGKLRSAGLLPQLRVSEIRQGKVGRLSPKFEAAPQYNIFQKR